MDMTQQHTFRTATSNQAFWDRCIEMVLSIAAGIRTEGAIDDHARRLVWGAAAEKNPEGKVQEMQSRITTHWLIQSVGAAVADEQAGETPGLRQVIESIVPDYL